MVVNLGENLAHIGQKAKVVLVRGPVDQDSFANNTLAGYKTPLARIGTAAAIIAHYKISILSHCKFDNRAIRTRDIGLSNIGFMQRDGIHRYLVADDTDDIAGNSDHAFHKILPGIIGVSEDDNIAACWGLKKIGRPVDDYILLVMQRWLHTIALDVKVLQGAANDEQHQDSQPKGFKHEA